MNYFTRDELKCKCGCEAMKCPDEFIKKLNALRDSVGFPLVVTSAYRCPTHNKNVSGTGTNGPHTSGLACDFAVSGDKAYAVLSAAIRLGFTGIGVQQKGSGRFIHVDTIANGPTTPRPFVWSYP